MAGRGHSARQWRWEVGTIDDQQNDFKTHRWQPGGGFLVFNTALAPAE
jgi:hypothetical protein